jgi:hypothetical protein
MSRFACLILAGLFLVSCQSTHTYKPSTRNAGKIGQIYSSTLRVGAVRTPLPAGRWELVSWREPRASNNTIIHYVVLAKNNGKHVNELLRIRANESSSPQGWAASRDCQRNHDFHHMEVESYASGAGGEGLCWGVAQSVWSQTFKGAAEQYRQDLANWTTSKGLRKFNYGIGQNFYAARFNFISMSYIKNPVAIGFPDHPSSNWVSHPWSKANIRPGSPEYQYVQARIKEATRWWPTFKTARY